MRLVLRFWYWINSFTQLIVFFILITYLVDIVGEILSWSLMGVYGLRGVKIDTDCK